MALIGLILPTVECHCTEACVFGSYAGRAIGKLIPFKIKCDFQKFKMFAAAACGDLQRVCREEFEPGLTLLRQIHSPIGVQVSSTR